MNINSVNNFNFKGNICMKNACRREFWFSPTAPAKINNGVLTVQERIYNPAYSMPVPESLDQDKLNILRNFAARTDWDVTITPDGNIYGKNTKTGEEQKLNVENNRIISVAPVIYQKF